MIDQATVSRIIDAARIEEVVGEFVSLRRRGANYTGLCPFHDERTPSFSVSPSKGICKCFSCGKGGNVVHFIMEHEQLSYYEALKWLAKRYHIEVVEKELTPEELQQKNERESMLVVNEFARDYFSAMLHNQVESHHIGMAYFVERGLREESIQRFQLGYCSENREAFSKAALAKGYRKELLVKTGLSIETEQHELFDRYRGRVIFPIHSLSGKVVAFGGRILKKSDKLAKYINSPESELYHKSNELYGLFQAKQSIVKQDRCYLVEGYLDVISMHQAGICNTVASSGTSLTPGQIRLIHRFTENVTVLYDGDAAGIKASLRGINLLLEEGLNIKVVSLPDGEDPDSYAQSHSASETLEFIQQNEVDFIQFKTDILLKDCAGDPIARSKAIEDILESIALIPNDIVRSEYVKLCAQLLHTKEELLLQTLSKKRRQTTERNRMKREAEKRRIESGSENTAPTDIAENETIENSPTRPLEAMPRETTSRKNPFEAHEKNLIRMVVRYGERSLTSDDGQSLSLAEYIHQDLDNDGIELTQPIYRDILEEAYQLCRNESFVAERHFLQHRRKDISLLAAELVTDRYEVSRIYFPQTQKETTSKDSPTSGLNFFHNFEKEENSLDTIVPRLLEELKYKFIKVQLVGIKQDIRQAEADNDEEKLLQALQQYQQLHELEKAFAKSLGERIFG